MTATDVVSAFIDRAAIRGRLLRLSPLDALRHRAVAQRRMAFRPPTVPGITAAVAAAVAAEGAFVTYAAGDLLGPRARRVIDDLIVAGAAAWAWHGSHFLLESQDILVQAPHVYALGLDPALLDLAEYYLQQPCYYLGCSLKRERVDSSFAGTRQWHHDIEDDRMLRLLVYLGDVGPDGGPFQYLKQGDSTLARTRLGYRSGYVSDADMRAALPDGDWHQVIGPAGTLIAFDGTRIFHRATPPADTERLSLSLTFSTRHPRQILRPVRLRSATRRHLIQTLPDRQRACIPGARWS